MHVEALGVQGGTAAPSTYYHKRVVNRNLVQKLLREVHFANGMISLTGRVTAEDSGVMAGSAVADRSGASAVGAPS